MVWCGGSAARVHRGIEASWAGGERGREVIDRLLPMVKVRATVVRGVRRCTHGCLRHPPCARCSRALNGAGGGVHTQALLSPSGVFYMLVVRDNDPADIAAVLAAQGLSCEEAIKRKAMNERLSVLRIQHC